MPAKPEEEADDPPAETGLAHAREEVGAVAQARDHAIRQRRQHRKADRARRKLELQRRRQRQKQRHQQQHAAERQEQLARASPAPRPAAAVESLHAASQRLDLLLAGLERPGGLVAEELFQRLDHLVHRSGSGRPASSPASRRMTCDRYCGTLAASRSGGVTGSRRCLVITSIARLARRTAGARRAACTACSPASRCRPAGRRVAASGRLLGRHVRGRAHRDVELRACVARTTAPAAPRHLARRRASAPSAVFTSPRSATFTMPVPVEHQVFRLHVAVDHAVVVRELQPPRRLQHVAHRHLRVEPALLVDHATRASGPRRTPC